MDMTAEELMSLAESNAIEGVYDEDSLDQAILAWRFLRKQKKLTLGVICKTHKILMLHKNLQPDQKGYFRKCPVWVGGREGLDWMLVPDAVHHWCQNAMDLVNNGKKESKIFIGNVAKRQHITYEKIHPFVDGNGRTGRMLLNWERLQAGLPILIIKESERQEYYAWFREEE